MAYLRLPLSADNERVLEDIYTLCGVPESQRELIQPQLSQLLKSGRPDSISSIISSSTTSDAGRSSNRSTVLSEVSSRSSYASEVFIPALRDQHDYTSTEQREFALTRPISKRPHSIDSVTSTRQRNNGTDVKATDKQLLPQSRCPWCEQGFTRPHDFRKHVKKYCANRHFWVCRNKQCQHAAYSETQAKRHRNQEGALNCKQLGWIKIELKCDRRNYGCKHCSTYFDNLDAYLEHLTRDCKPCNVSGKGHRTYQIRALLQQPDLKHHVEALCLEYRQDRNAYLHLWWTWKKDAMAKIVEQLEYGVKTSPVDAENPGLYIKNVGAFLRKLIEPSQFSKDISEIVHRPAQNPAPTIAPEKPLPPLPLVSVEISSCTYEAGYESNRNEIPEGSDDNGLIGNSHDTHAVPNSDQLLTHHNQEQSATVFEAGNFNLLNSDVKTDATMFGCEPLFYWSHLADSMSSDYPGANWNTFPSGDQLADLSSRDAISNVSYVSTPEAVHAAFSLRRDFYPNTTMDQSVENSSCNM